MGSGAWHQSSWFKIQWDHRAQALSIAAKELIPIILACNTWGSSWTNRQVLRHCDNQVVVASLRSRSSCDEGLMHLIRCLVCVEASHNCYLNPQYIPTKANHLADDLSRDNVSSFLQCSLSQPLLITSITAASGPPGSNSLLDFSVLAPSVQFYFKQGLAPSTLKTYQAATKRFYSFCTSHNVLNPFLLTEQLLCCYSSLATQGLDLPDTRLNWVSTGSLCVA